MLLAHKVTDSAICQRRGGEKKNLQLCRKLFCKSLLAVQNASRRTLAEAQTLEYGALGGASSKLKSVPRPRVCNDTVVPSLNGYLDVQRGDATLHPKTNISFGVRVCILPQSDKKKKNKHLYFSSSRTTCINKTFVYVRAEPFGSVPAVVHSVCFHTHTRTHTQIFLKCNVNADSPSIFYEPNCPKF